MAAPVSPDRPVAFFCAEYAVHGSLPVYSGGLGALAGDILKEASDRALPLVAVGLMYRQGYFRQRIDAFGWQHEYWVDTDPDRVPGTLVRGEDGQPLTVTVPIGEERITAQIWRVDVGRVPLFLLDSDRPENDYAGRWITARLYAGDPEVRLAQYTLLGIGGMRALDALGIEPGRDPPQRGPRRDGGARARRPHDGRRRLARGRLRRRCASGPSSPPTRRSPPATTATRPSRSRRRWPASPASWALDPEQILRRGRTRPDDAGEEFGVTQFALRTSRAANGVSRRHGEVAREMWNDLWPESSVDEVPIAHVTNGVHEPTWVGGPMRRLLDRHLGADWLDRAADPATWAGLDEVPDAELWATRCEQRAAMVQWLRERSVFDRLGRGDPGAYAKAAARALSADTLTLGFARRLATYKRVNLLARDPDRSRAVLLDRDRPVQMVLAGKAHPRDDEGKKMVRDLFAVKADPAVGERAHYLDDYDLGKAAWLVQGCDVWLNLPRPPLEASGTSGMKSAVNGGLQLSVLDGWWAEGYDGNNGWALSGDVDPDHAAQDARHAAELFDLLEREVIPSFYDRDADGIPRAWVARMRASLKSIGPEFSAGRMVRDYAEGIYPE